MGRIKPSVPKGTRDFSPGEVARRELIFNTIKRSFEKHGFQPIETPAMENLSTLTGKYGEEGDRLLFKILNSGEYLNKVRRQNNEIENWEESQLTPLISERGLRYDLTVPFARYVVQHQHEIIFPFKRYQIQPVWRADKPQKGRYREFYQCDADIIGSDSLMNEAELILIYDEVYRELGIYDLTISLNNRKLLQGLTEVAGVEDRFMEITIAIDKMDKIGMDGVLKELEEKGITGDPIDKISSFFTIDGSNREKLLAYEAALKDSTIGLKGVEEMQTLLNYLDKLKPGTAKINIDITLARGLTYYTGTIIEAEVNNVKIGSIGGGGRYDDLTGMFGLKGVSGVGISFGADRIYDVMEELELFPAGQDTFTRLLFVHFDKKSEGRCLEYVQEAWKSGIKAEIFPTQEKLKKQMKYADSKNIPYVALIGAAELKENKITLKNMSSGEQESLPLQDVLKRVK